MSVKGLHKIIYPFAPDQSGAASVLYELGGMIIICDAGGCAGNICGFDEPRWLDTKSAIFSAGLRDMDAILGRDDLMIEKITKASKKLDAEFVAIIGTPVPATIATDYKALRRMGEKRIGLPVITLDTNGALWYDDGISKAYLELFRRFAQDDQGDVIPGSAGVIGAVPLDIGRVDAGNHIREKLLGEGFSEVISYGQGHSLSDIAAAGRMEKNIVVSAAGLKAARYLKERYGTPYICCDPLIDEVWAGLEEQCGHGFSDDLRGKRILIIHQQVRANALRDMIRKQSDADVTVATWFMLDDEISEPEDIRIREEYDFIELAQKDKYDVIIADGSLRKAVLSSGIGFIDLPHFAVSGHISL